MFRQRPPSAGNNQQKLDEAKDNAQPDLSLFDRIRAVRARGPQPAPPVAEGVAKLDPDLDLGGSNPPKARGLNASERAAAEGVFGNSIDLDAIRLHPGGVGAAFGAFRTIGNTIHVPMDHYVRRDDRGYRIDNLEESLPTLIHEFTHVWQYQNVGPGYMAKGPAVQLLYFLAVQPSFAYERWAVDVQAGVPWQDMNVEEQGDLVEAYYTFQTVHDREVEMFGSSEITKIWIGKLQPYIDKLRAGVLKWPSEEAPDPDYDTPMFDI